MCFSDRVCQLQFSGITCFCRFESRFLSDIYLIHHILMHILSQRALLAISWVLDSHVLFILISL